MADRRKKKKGQEGEGEAEIKPSKLEYDIANYMRANVPTKRTQFLSHPVKYFNGSKAIDALLDSKWATGDSAIFSDRESVVHFGNKLLRHKFFHRAKKIAISDKDLSVKELKKKKEKKKKEAEKKALEEQDIEDGKKLKKKSSKPKEEKKKHKIKLDMHLEQLFVDSSDAYVWIYDPIPFWYYIVGGLLLFSAVAICLFPLWPPYIRQGVYYLSLGAAGFLGVILGLAVLRFIVFVIIWILSMGQHHFWMLPNLTEDVGFFESFWPLYEYEYRGKDFVKKTKKKKLKFSDEVNNESESGSNLKTNDENQSTIENDTDKPDTDVDGTPAKQLSESQASSNSDSEPSNSQTFEVLEKEELSDKETVKN